MPWWAMWLLLSAATTFGYVLGALFGRMRAEDELQARMERAIQRVLAKGDAEISRN